MNCLKLPRLVLPNLKTRTFHTVRDTQTLITAGAYTIYTFMRASTFLLKSTRPNAKALQKTVYETNVA